MFWLPLYIVNLYTLVASALGLLQVGQTIFNLTSNILLNLINNTAGYIIL
jgi:hypothetical protein